VAETCHETRMRCLHPFCPAGNGAATWEEVLDLPEVGLQPAGRAAALAVLTTDFAASPSTPAIARPAPPIGPAVLKRLLNVCPCLFNQIEIAATARSVVHFCELTLAEPISALNVHQAFLIQHPREPGFAPGPLKSCSSGGTVMEMLCSEVLSTAGIPAMPLAADGWPIWNMPGHILLNQRKMSSLQALGDLLIPCAPTNLVISVKSEVARERLLYSANSIEGIGFGFFKEPEEFWTDSRMALYKRMGFTAIYMPDETHESVMEHVNGAGSGRHAININGTDLYRPLAIFADDMLRVIGRSSALL
jgi:hypothetical protein